MKRGISTTVCMAELEEKSYKALKDALTLNGIPPYYYSLNGYSEEAICIEKNKDVWNVYLGERGKKNNTKSFTNVNEACLEMIASLTESYEQEKKTKEDFEQNCKFIPSGFAVTGTMRPIGSKSFNTSNAGPLISPRLKSILVTRGNAVARQRNSAVLAEKQFRTKKTTRKTVKKGCPSAKVSKRA